MMKIDERVLSVQEHEMNVLAVKTKSSLLIFGRELFGQEHTWIGRTGAWKDEAGKIASKWVTEQLDVVYKKWKWSLIEF